MVHPVALLPSSSVFLARYDPVHYGVPEGSYASDPHGESRIREFRQMVQAIHGMGLRVVLDVVYNHTFHSGLDGGTPCLSNFLTYILAPAPPPPPPLFPAGCRLQMHLPLRA